MTLSTLNKPIRSPNLLIGFISVKKRLESTLQALFQQLNNQTWSGTQYSNAYDTAWGASLQTSHKKPYFPQAVQWLLHNQHYDGSWGSGVRDTITERMLSTATVLGTLLQYDFSNDVVEKNVSHSPRTDILKNTPIALATFCANINTSMSSGEKNAPPHVTKRK